MPGFLTYIFLFAFLFFRTGAYGASPLPTAPPPSKVEPVIDNYFGTKVIDPYRWMEAEPEPQFRTMLEQQNTYARAVLASISGRDRLRDDIASTSGLATTLPTIVPVPGRNFYIKRPPGAQGAKLYVSDAFTHQETLLVDPDTLSTEGKHAEIDQFAPSQDGSLVSYGLSSGGSELSTLHVMRTATQEKLRDQIDRTQLTSISWLPDGESFFYTRLAKMTPGAPASEYFAHMRVYLHRLGTDPDSDREIIDVDHLPVVFKTPLVFPSLQVTPGSQHVLLGLSDGISPEMAIYTVPITDLLRGNPDWKPVATQTDGVTGSAVRGDTVFLLTHHNAPRFQIVSEDLRSPGFATAKTMVAQDRGVLTGLTAAADGIYVAERQGGSMVLERLPDGADRPVPIALPYAGTITPAWKDAGGLIADPRMPGTLFSLVSWMRPVTWFGFDPKDGKVSDIGAVPPFPRKLTGYDTIETEAQSLDGTKVPLTIVARHGIVLDGSHPTLLSGYGSFGISSDASFFPFVQPWLDHDGVFAVAHVRGGGELGQPWHDGGKIASKQNTITDFIACAEELVRRGYTTSARLDGMGTSGGGILIGGAITRRPDLFRAALIRVGLTNVLRLENTENGPGNVPEFGTVKSSQQFPFMLKMDAFHQVHDSTHYPAVLLTGGFNDPRVPVWMPAKMAARLQAATSSRLPVLFRVEFDAGHGMGSTRQQQDREWADSLAFLLWQDGVPGFQPTQ